MTTTQTIAVTPRSTGRARTFTVRRDEDGTIVLTNSQGADTGYVFPNMQNLGPYVMGPCMSRWTARECREVAALALAALGA